MLETCAATDTGQTEYRLRQTPCEIRVELLTRGQEQEVIEFLSQRPIHTVTMMSLVMDNGLVSPMNRGNFYGARDINGHLEGVALIGHATLLETASDRALGALAQVARACKHTHMIMAEQARVSDLWEYYIDAGVEKRLACRESLFELRWPVHVNTQMSSLRPATEAELDQVVPIQAQLAFQESGIDPRKVDANGFRERCLRRIKMNRTWVLVENGSVVFKADVISQTPTVIYLEGIWVDEQRRNFGVGVDCMAELSRRLLDKAKSLCLLVNENNKQAQAFYRKCGFLFRSTYETIFLPQKEALSSH